MSNTFDAMDAKQHIAEGAAALRSDDSALAVFASHAEFAKLVQEDLAIRAADARTMGVSWQQIGDALGITRQAAHIRYARFAPEEQS